MRRPFRPIVTGSVLAALMILGGLFFRGCGGQPDSEWEKVKTEKDAGLPSDDPSGFEVVLRFKGDFDATGQVVAGLFGDESSFKLRENPLQSCFLKLETDGTRSWTFQNVPPGSYAISAYHDPNENSTLDKGAFGVPKEKYGFSNDARGKFGPPAFAECEFEVDGDRELEITLK